MKANEMEPGPRDKRGQALEEFQRAHHEMGGAIEVWGFELEDDLTGPSAAHPFVAQGGACDVTTETLQGMPLMGTTAGIGMQAKPLGTHTTLWL